MSRTKAAIILTTGLLLMIGLFSLFAFLGQRKDTAVQAALATSRTALEEGRMEAAEAGFREVLAIDARQPEAAAALFDLSLYFDPDQAAEWLAALKDMDADPGLVLYREARLALQEKDTETARRAVERLEALELTGPETLLARLVLMVAEEQYAEAIPLLLSLSEAFPGDRHIRLLSSEVYLNQPEMLHRIRAKQILFDLLDYPDEYAFVAGVLLALNRSIPLFPEDFELVAESLAAHPHFEAGIRQFEAPLLGELVLRLADFRPALAHRVSSILVGLPGATHTDELVHIYARQRILAGTQEEAIAFVEELLDEDPAAALQFLAWLANERFEMLDDSGKEWLANTLRRHPDTPVELHLDAIAWLATAQPDTRTALIDEAVARFAAGHRTLLSQWLVRLGEYARVLALIDEQEALANRDFLFPYLDAHVLDDRNEQAMELIRRADALIEPAHRDLLLARIHLRMGDPDACLALISALPATLPPESRGILFPIAELAASTGAKALRREAYELAYTAGLVFPVNHSMGYLEMLLDAGELGRSLDFTAYCRNLQSANPYYINNHTYVKMVAGRWAEDCILDMQAIVEQHPNVPYFKLTYALAQVMGGYSGRALETLAQLDPEALPKEPRSRLTYALVLAGTGSQQEAEPIIQTIDVNALMEMERVLIDRYFRDGRF